MADETLLTVTEAAARLCTSEDWLYRNWQGLPFAVKLSPKQLRFSMQGIQKYIEEKQHAGESVQAG